MTRLGTAGLAAIAGVERFAYDREAQRVGIVHFGIGAFHRAHQAWYTDRAMDAGDRDWAIAGVSLRSAAVMDQLAPQEGLYTVTERDGAGARTRIVGAVRDVLVAARHGEAIVARIADPACRIVSFTVTEKGYCRRPDGALDHPMADRGFYPLLAEALAQRAAAGLPGVTLLPCDNLTDNGGQLSRLVSEYLHRRRPALAAWFEGECACPSTMVDRIVPATTDADRAALERTLGGVHDAAAVFTEPFSQWIIEDRFAGPRPGWEAVGAEIVADVAPYETAKLRMLNGAHSLLAYCGLERGWTYVHEAVADPELRSLAERLMREEAAPTIARAPGQDLDAYAEALLARFANPALQHRLIQIAMDGSQKIPQRWLETYDANVRGGRASPAIARGFGAWLRHMRGANVPEHGPVDDPAAAAIAGVLGPHGTPDAAAALFSAAGPFHGHVPIAE